MYKRLWKFIFEWNYPLGREECPYAYRWRLDFYWFSFRIHKWISSDDTRAFHNHPWHFITFVLKGYYIDVTPQLLTPNISQKEYVKQYTFHYRNKDHKHYVEIPKEQSPVWTFVTTFSKPRKYAFWNVKTGKRKNRDKYFIEEKEAPCGEK